MHASDYSLVISLVISLKRSCLRLLLLLPVCLQAVAVLHCLQRLASNPHMAEQVMSAPAALARVWACLACGSDHVVAEAARLLVRLMAPAPARHGAPPWRLLRGAHFGGCA
jgi:hypothetical protein